MNTEQSPQTYPMKYCSCRDVMDIVEEAENKKSGSPLIVDVRRFADYLTGHIPGAISVDVDSAKHGHYKESLQLLTSTLTHLTGSKCGGGRTMILVCYRGKSCAQMATNLLSVVGASMDVIFTMEGGMGAWSTQYPHSIEIS